MYQYKAVVTDVYDGDTITVDIDLGFGVWMRDQKVRLFGVNTPELRGESKSQGLLVRDVVRRMIFGRQVELETFKGQHDVDKKGKFGRWLARVHVDGTCVNDYLLEAGHAVPYFASIGMNMNELARNLRHSAAQSGTTASKIDQASQLLQPRKV